MTHKFKATREEFLHLGHLFADQEGTALFYSGGAYSAAKDSFLCLFPSEKVAVELNGTQNPWDVLKSELHLNGDEPSLPTWIGYLSYELGSFSDISKRLPIYTPSIPLAIFYKPTIILKFDHNKQLVTIYGNEKPGFLELLSRSREIKASPLFQVRCIQKESQEEYLQKITIAKEHILDGNIYQVNLSHQTLFQGKMCPFSYFEKVMLANPAPFAAFIQTNDFSLISSSPERFLSKSGNKLTAMPIKGTHPRGNTAKEDMEQMTSLKSSTKEQSELLMITDLMRNDLGKVSMPGSVKTEELYHLEAYQNVFHLSSLITSEVKPDLHPLDILRSAFPGGSISGCPKIKALEIIYELEKRPRHIYTGSIGYLTNRGDFDFNIAIRTCLYKEEILDIQLGAGIVFDSDPSSEYLETLSKGQTLFGALK